MANVKKKASKKAKTAKTAKKAPRSMTGEGRVYINASFNNTLVTITDEKGAPLGWTSCGKLGFKGTRKSTPYAANTTLESAIETCPVSPTQLTVEF